MRITTDTMTAVDTRDPGGEGTVVTVRAYARPVQVDPDKADIAGGWQIFGRVVTTGTCRGGGVAARHEEDEPYGRPAPDRPSPGDLDYCADSLASAAAAHYAAILPDARLRSGTITAADTRDEHGSGRVITCWASAARADVFSFDHFSVEILISTEEYHEEARMSERVETAPWGDPVRDAPTRVELDRIATVAAGAAQRRAVQRSGTGV